MGTTHQMLLLMMQADQLAKRFPMTFPKTTERQLSNSTQTPTSDQLLLTQNALTGSPPVKTPPQPLPLGLQLEPGNSVKASLNPVRSRLSVELERSLKFNQSVPTVIHALTML